MCPSQNGVQIIDRITTDRYSFQASSLKLTCNMSIKLKHEHLPIENQLKRIAEHFNAVFLRGSPTPCPHPQGAFLRLRDTETFKMPKKGRIKTIQLHVEEKCPHGRRKQLKGWKMKKPALKGWKKSWQVFVTFFGVVKWPFQGLRDLQLGD